MYKRTFGPSKLTGAFDLRTIPRSLQLVTMLANMILQPLQLIWITAAFFWVLNFAQPVLTEPAGEAHRCIALTHSLTTL